MSSEVCLALYYLRLLCSAHKLVLPENLLLASIGVIREILVALSTQLISNADKVTSADTQGTFSRTTNYVNSSILGSIYLINEGDTS